MKPINFKEEFYRDFDMYVFSLGTYRTFLYSNLCNPYRQQALDNKLVYVFYGTNYNNIFNISQHNAWNDIRKSIEFTEWRNNDE